VNKPQHLPIEFVAVQAPTAFTKDTKHFSGALVGPSLRPRRRQGVPGRLTTPDHGRPHWPWRSSSSMPPKTAGGRSTSSIWSRWSVPAPRSSTARSSKGPTKQLLGRRSWRATPRRWSDRAFAPGASWRARRCGRISSSSPPSKTRSRRCTAQRAHRLASMRPGCPQIGPPLRQKLGSGRVQVEQSGEGHRPALAAGRAGFAPWPADSAEPSPGRGLPRPLHEHSTSFGSRPTRRAAWQPAAFRHAFLAEHQQACPRGRAPASWHFVASG
jgi:hypothetical protein